MNKGGIERGRGVMLDDPRQAADSIRDAGLTVKDAASSSLGIRLNFLNRKSVTAAVVDLSGKLCRDSKLRGV